MERLPHLTWNGRGLSLALAVADLLAAGGSAVVVGGERLADRGYRVWRDDFELEVVRVARFAAPGLRCVWPDGGVWLVATSSRVEAGRLLERALAELELVA